MLFYITSRYIDTELESGCDKKNTIVAFLLRADFTLGIGAVNGSFDEVDFRSERQRAAERRDE
jgi:hypothetical protein